MTRRTLRREDRVTVQGPIRKPAKDEVSHLWFLGVPESLTELNRESVPGSLRSSSSVAGTANT